MSTEHSFDPRPFERTYAAWLAADRELAGGSWSSLEDLREVMTAAADILPKTASNILGDATRAGVLQKRARADRGREYRLHPSGLDKAAELRVR